MSDKDLNQKPNENNEIDSNVIIPDSVKAASKRADELVNGLVNPSSDDRSPEALQDKNQPSSPESTQPDKGTVEPGSSAQPDMTQGGPAVPPESQEKDLQYYKSRFETVQGKYNAEVPRLSKKVSYLESELRIANQTIADIKAASVSTTENQPGSDPETAQLNPDDMAEYGDEFVAMAKQNQTLVQQNKQLLDELADLKKSIGSIQESREVDSETAFWTQLTQLCPDWEALNQDQSFIAYLRQPIHPYTQKPIQEVLNQMVSEQKAEAVARIFNDYIQLTNGSQKQETPSTTTTRQPQPASSQEIPNVQPGTRRTDTGAPKSNQRIWTPKKISEHYAQKTRGEWAGREAEWKALESDLIAAQNDNRIQPD